MTSHRKSHRCVPLLVSFFLWCQVTSTIGTVAGGAVTGGRGVSAGAVFMKLHPPLPNKNGPRNSVGKNSFNEPNLYAFDEGQNLVLGSEPLVLDIVPEGGSTVLPPGTVVSSHFVFYDPADNNILGYVDFTTDIIGVMERRERQTEIDPFVRTDVIYLDPRLRGLEGRDRAWVDEANRKRLWVEFFASSPGDYIRVLTAPSSPLPPEVLVPARADIQLAGYSVGITNAIGSVVPSESPVEMIAMPVRTGSYLTFEASGEVKLPDSMGGETVGPNGSAGRILARASGGQRAVSGITGPAGALVGVFLGSAPPGEGLTPASLDFSPAGMGTAPGVLMPRLKQVFVIGTGSDDSGVSRRIYVPVTATRLFMGVFAASNQAAMAGGFTVTVRSQPNALLFARSVTRERVDLCWDAVPDVDVQLESATDPVHGPWTPVGAKLPGDGPDRCASVPRGAGVQVFYRLAMEPR